MYEVGLIIAIGTSAEIKSNSDSRVNPFINAHVRLRL